MLAKKGENSPTLPFSNFETLFLTTLTKCSVIQQVLEVKIFFIVYQYDLGQLWFTRKKIFEIVKFFLSKTAKPLIFFDRPNWCRLSPAVKIWSFFWKNYVKIYNISKIWGALFGLSGEIPFLSFLAMAENLKNGISPQKPKTPLQILDML